MAGRNQKPEENPETKLEENPETKPEVNQETKPEVNQETKPEVNQELELVDVTFPKERGIKGQQEIVIMVNGKAWHIIKGEKVRVPRYVLTAYDNNEKNRDEAEAYIIENASS